MNKLELRRVESRYSYPVIVPFIDGKDLRELARAIERPWAAADGEPERAGSYMGVNEREIVREHFCHLAGTGLDRKLGVLACEGCNVTDCWPLRLQVTLRTNQVVWSDFEQPYRKHWTHEGLGPFVFERRQYEAEWEVLWRAWPEGRPTD